VADGRAEKSVLCPALFSAARGPKAKNSFWMFFFSLHTLTKAVRIAHKFQDMGMMGEPVNQSGGQSFVSEDLRPIAKFKVAGHDDSGSLVEF
jgi:hypothetical protein